LRGCIFGVVSSDCYGVIASWPLFRHGVHYLVTGLRRYLSFVLNLRAK
jgi:hypothetical protein